jgi:hypothetical protein
MSDERERIRVLNDKLHRHLLGGRAVITPDIAALGKAAVERLFQTVSIFDDFCTANDPHEEHDFGVLDFEGTRVMFKIDYYDKTLKAQSPDPANPSLTNRVITIVLAEEY